MRRPCALARCATLAGLAAYAPAAIAMDFEDEIFSSEPLEITAAPPVEGSPEWADLIAARFAETDGWETEFVKDGKGDPEAVRLFLPSPLKVGDAADPGEPVETVLPLEPPGHVSRFKKIPFDDGVEGKVAFRFADIGWNAGGGDSRSQVDILFHTGSLEETAATEDCAADSEDCTPPPTEKEIAKRLADRPPKCFLPAGSKPVAERTTPETGLFNLASGPDNGPEAPEIIYGTYDDEIVFLGVALMLETLQFAVAEGVLGDRLSWPISQPARYRYSWWPNTIALEYRDDQRRFALSLEDFSKRRVQAACK